VKSVLFPAERARPVLSVGGGRAAPQQDDAPRVSRVKNRSAEGHSDDKPIATEWVASALAGRKRIWLLLQPAAVPRSNIHTESANWLDSTESAFGNQLPAPPPIQVTESVLCFDIER